MTLGKSLHLSEVLISSPVKKCRDFYLEDTLEADGGTGMREGSGSASSSVQTVIPLGEGLEMGERHMFTTGVTNTSAPGKLQRADG